MEAGGLVGGRIHRLPIPYMKVKFERLGVADRLCGCAVRER